MIILESVGKAYRKRGEVLWPLRNINTSFPAGQHVGILAGEGEGKTTLVNLLCGRDKPTEGEISRRGEVSWPFADRSSFANGLTGRQNLRFLTDMYARPFGEASEFVTEFTELGRKMDLPLRQYTNEQRNRLSVAILFAMDFDYIVVDNQLGVGDVAFRRKIANFITDNTNSFSLVLITENPKMVSRFCERGGVLRNGKLTMYDSVEEAVNIYGEQSAAYA